MTVENDQLSQLQVIMQNDEQQVHSVYQLHRKQR